MVLVARCNQATSPNWQVTRLVLKAEGFLRDVGGRMEWDGGVDVRPGVEGDGEKMLGFPDCLLGGYPCRELRDE